MKKKLVLVSILAVALVGTLYSLPKIVVNTKDQGIVSEQNTGQASDEGKVEQAEAPADSHSNETLTPEQEQALNPLRSAYQQASAVDKAETAIKLSDTFGRYQKFDSAAFYADQAARLSPQVENYLRAGDRYYEAYGFATDEEKAKVLGEKTRTYYQKALDQNSELLAAKANMAMTYVSTPSPMQGICCCVKCLRLTRPTSWPCLIWVSCRCARTSTPRRWIVLSRFYRITPRIPRRNFTWAYAWWSWAKPRRPLRYLRM